MGFTLRLPFTQGAFELDTRTGIMKCLATRPRTFNDATPNAPVGTWSIPSVRWTPWPAAAGVWCTRVAVAYMVKCVSRTCCRS